MDAALNARQSTFSSRCYTRSFTALFLYIDRFAVGPQMKDRSGFVPRDVVVDFFVSEHKRQLRAENGIASTACSSRGSLRTYLGPALRVSVRLRSITDPEAAAEEKRKAEHLKLKSKFHRKKARPTLEQAELVMEV